MLYNVKMATKTRGAEYTRVASNIKPDAKKRIVLPAALVGEDVIFHIYHNNRGQILLDPQVTIPVSEAWLFNNPVALALVQQGLSDAVQGKVSKVDLDTL